MPTDESKKRRILSAAGPIFASKGYRDATVRDISQAADVNLASINYYYGDKQNLYFETVKSARDQRFTDIPAFNFALKADPAENLGDFVQHFLRRLLPSESEPWQAKLLLREFINPSDSCRDLIMEIIQPVFQNLVKIVDQKVDSCLEEHQLRKIGFSIVGQCLHYRYASEAISMLIEPENLEQHFEVDQIAQHITAFSMGGIERLKQSATDGGERSETS